MNLEIQKTYIENLKQISRLENEIKNYKRQKNRIKNMVQEFSDKFEEELNDIYKNFFPHVYNSVEFFTNAKFLRIANELVVVMYQNDGYLCNNWQKLLLKEEKKKRDNLMDFVWEKQLRILLHCQILNGYHDLFDKFMGDIKPFKMRFQKEKEELKEKIAKIERESTTIDNKQNEIKILKKFSEALLEKYKDDIIVI